MARPPYSPVKNDDINSGFKHLTILMVLYTCIILMANWFDARLIDIDGLVTDSGTLIFPLTYILSDVITEVYGYKYARKCIWMGLVINVVFILYGQLVISMPSPPQSNILHMNNEFKVLVNTGTRIVVASIVSYIIAEPCNSIIMSQLKIKMQGKYMGCRFLLSTVFAAGIDSTIFSLVAFSGIMSAKAMILFILSMWFVKVVVEVVVLNLSKCIALKLKKIERLDIYDYGTSYRFLSLETFYPKENNKYIP